MKDQFIIQRLARESSHGRTAEIRSIAAYASSLVIVASTMEQIAERAGASGNRELRAKAIEAMVKMDRDIMVVYDFINASIAGDYTLPLIIKTMIFDFSDKKTK